MKAIHIKELLEEKILNSQIIVEGEGCNFKVKIICDRLANFSSIERQRIVYDYLNPWIIDRTIHAVTMEFFSRATWFKSI